MGVDVVDVPTKLARFSEHWSPKLVARVNDHDVRVVKFRGEFVWHSHADEDELFYVLKGTMRLRLRDGDVLVGPGQLVVVPRGVEHCTSADEEVHALLVEPSTVVNTGDVVEERTVVAPERI